MPGAARVGDIASSHDCFPETPAISGSPDISINGRPALRVGDECEIHACTCPGSPHGVHKRQVAKGSSTVSFNGKPAARIGDESGCGGVIISGSNNVFIGDTPYHSPIHDCAAQAVLARAPLIGLSPQLHDRVFAKSTLRGEGCTDAGTAPESQTHFAPFGLFQQIAGGGNSAQAPQTQHEPSAGAFSPQPDNAPWYQKLFSPEQAPGPNAAPSAATSTPPDDDVSGNHATALIHYGGAFCTPGAWSVSSPDAHGGILIGMMPGKRDAAEARRDYLDKEQLTRQAASHEAAPTRVRFTWQDGRDGTTVPVGYHTPKYCGQDSIPVLLMRLNPQTRQYEATLPGRIPLTLYWRSDNTATSESTAPGQADGQVIPLKPHHDPTARSTFTVTPQPLFTDCILIIPVDDIPPLYVFVGRRTASVFSH
ncbi:hypothetical protein M942_09335 [Enterobacter ludwigii]|uniref:S-type pyocin domain-containing protein n=1 Tax=Enterobacter TaxID=547 RepID=UPI0003D82532|nr:S-type pyocin domain-containing protein [Enterobacter ludwigii]AHE72820.1 hypothetical protein M942_09335 [Enterobacter ludwigii]HDR2587499.1 S-type pyocin domain-containing protein [Enterobacter ludwigii]HDR2598943.1 S-type pyocin domain-containing protein [Enterobacter ludwigii]